MMPAIEIASVGLGATVQDLGRPGYAHLGVGMSGAVDRGALRLANRLAGNAEHLPVVESVAMGASFSFVVTVDVTLAVAGAPRLVTWPGAARWSQQACRVPAGVPVTLHPAERGMYSYLAVRGGLDVPLTLGSASTDLLSGLGPRALRAGDRLAIGAHGRAYAPVDSAPTRTLPDIVELRVVPGPRSEWFEGLEPLFASDYVVTPSSNRIGLRLAGGALARRVRSELPSEGVVVGALQVPPNGQPILFLADRPVTGGYPVAAVVIDTDLDRAGQAQVGQIVRFQQLLRN